MKVSKAEAFPFIFISTVRRI